MLFKKRGLGKCRGSAVLSYWVWIQNWFSQILWAFDRLSMPGMPDGQGLHFSDYSVPLCRHAKSSAAKVFERKHIMWTQIRWRGLGDITYRETIMAGEFILRVMFVSHHPNAGWVQKGTPYQNVLQQKMKISVPIEQYLVVPPRLILKPFAPI